MSDGELSGADRKRIADALRLGSPDWDEWTEVDLAAVLAQQMAQPLDLILRGVADTAARQCLDAEKWGPRPLRDLFSAEGAPQALLKAVKDYAKISADDPDRSLPREVCKVIYFAALVAAKRAGAVVSSLSPQAVTRGAASLVDLPWLDKATRHLLKHAAAPR